MHCHTDIHTLRDGWCHSEHPTRTLAVAEKELIVFTYLQKSVFEPVCFDAVKVNIRC